MEAGDKGVREAGAGAGEDRAAEVRGCEDDRDTEGDTEGLGLNPGAEAEAERDSDPVTSGDFVC